MDILSQVEGIKILARLICERNVIPVFGAGFTMNNRAYKGQVPDGTHATMMMKKLLLENCSKFIEWSQLQKEISEKYKGRMVRTSAHRNSSVISQSSMVFLSLIR